VGVNAASTPDAAATLGREESAASLSLACSGGGLAQQPRYDLVAARKGARFSTCILELADALINKADGGNVNRATAGGYWT
jgi:hypothetical protein